MADGFFFFFFCVSPADPVGRIQFHLNVKWLCGKCFSHIIIPTSTDLDPVPQQPRMMTCFCVWQEDFVRIPLFKYFTIKAHFLRRNRQLHDRFKGCDAVRWFSNYHDMSEEVVRRACVQSFHLFDTYRWVSWSCWVHLHRQTGVWRPLWLCWCQSDAAAVICSQAWTQFETAVVTNLQQRVHPSGNAGKDPWDHRTSQWTISFKRLFTSYVVFVKRGGNTICSCYFHFHLRVGVTLPVFLLWSSPVCSDSNQVALWEL